MRVALVGAGFIAGSHAAAAAALPSVRLVAVTDRDAAAAGRFGAAWGVRVEPDVADLLAADDVDALVVCTPNDTHAELAQSAAAAGKHVLLEKPMALSAADARSVADAFAAADRVLLVGHTHRHADYARAVHEVIASGRLGAVRAVRIAITGGWIWGGWSAWVLDPARSGRTRLPQRGPPVRPGPLVARVPDRLGVCGGAAPHVRRPRHRRLPLQHARRRVRAPRRSARSAGASGRGPRRCSRSSSTGTAGTLVRSHGDEGLVAYTTGGSGPRAVPGTRPLPPAARGLRGGRRRRRRRRPASRPRRPRHGGRRGGRAVGAHRSERGGGPMTTRVLLAGAAGEAAGRHHQRDMFAPAIAASDLLEVCGGVARPARRRRPRPGGGAGGVLGRALCRRPVDGPGRGGRRRGLSGPGRPRPPARRPRRGRAARPGPRRQGRAPRHRAADRARR